MKAARLVVDDDGEPAMMDELTMRKTDGNARHAMLYCQKMIQEMVVM
jgi:hypothetical protein